ncbi:hypothetical protein BS47DRAFT_1360547 [Hydnum rufescens UP504]|uniref:Uncharacterized protein n=1 Tax=Hydnum rufescens UP504 TaxID=1448309 RepID=A0A9P6B1V3_9AGAM|nr:hypothetical protein BS47DRAFT_1360547 [Hydnum rufescens UP504]
MSARRTHSGRWPSDVLQGWSKKISTKTTKSATSTLKKTANTPACMESPPSEHDMHADGLPAAAVHQAPKTLRKYGSKYKHEATTSKSSAAQGEELVDSNSDVDADTDILPAAVAQKLPKKVALHIEAHLSLHEQVPIHPLFLLVNLSPYSEDYHGGIGCQGKGVEMESGISQANSIGCSTIQVPMQQKCMECIPIFVLQSHLTQIHLVKIPKSGQLKQGAKAGAAKQIAQSGGDIVWIMSSQKEKWMHDMHWLATMDIHSLIIMVSGNAASPAAHAQNECQLGSEEMAAWYCSKFDMPTQLADIYWFILAWHSQYQELHEFMEEDALKKWNEDLSNVYKTRTTVKDC